MKQGVADAVSNDFDDFDDEDCSDIEDDDGQEEYSEAKDSFGWVIEESDLLVDDATLQEYESDEEDEPAKPVKANGTMHIVHVLHTRQSEANQKTRSKGAKVPAWTCQMPAESL